MSALKAVVDSLESVPEAARELYTKTESGAFVLGVDGLDSHPEVAGLKSKRDTLLTEKKQIQEALDDFRSKYGDVDLDEVATLRKEKEEREQRKAEEKGEWDKLRSQLQDQHKGDLGKKDEEIKGLEGQLDNVLRENRARQELEEAEAYVDIALPHVLERTRTIREGGKLKTVVVNEQGERRLGREGNDMTIGELVAEMKGMEKYEPLFKGSDVTGGGASGRRVAGGGKATKSLKDMTEAEKIAFIEEHGAEEWQGLVAAAYPG